MLSSPSSVDVVDAVEASPQPRTRGFVRPTNVPRTIFHFGSGLVTLVLIRVLSREGLIVAACVFALSAWSCEVTRRLSPAFNARLMRVVKRFAHAHEWRKVNSATWYGTALMVMAFVMPLEAAEVGVVVLALADPMAGIIGRRFGRHRLASGRSLEGALAFACTGTLASLAWMHTMGTFDGSRLAVGLAAGIIGALIELFVSIDDNFAIPLGTAAAVLLVVSF
ncbi:MAG TPA: hypothetical protein VM580_01625 [Labilithrix sp.]|nr:hypothetical protein [Labilithrix sp.]